MVILEIYLRIAIKYVFDPVINKDYSLQYINCLSLQLRIDNFLYLYNDIMITLSTENNAKIVTEEKGLEDVYRALENHPDSAEVIESACSALWSLSMEGINLLVIILYSGFTILPSNSNEFWVKAHIHALLSSFFLQIQIKHLLLEIF